MPLADRASADLLAGNGGASTAFETKSVRSARRKGKKRKKIQTRKSSEAPFPDDPFDNALVTATVAQRNNSSLTTPKKVTKKVAGIPLADTRGVPIISKSMIQKIDFSAPRVMAASALQAPKPRKLRKDASSDESESSSSSEEENEEAKF